ncbi:hypothetical protein V5O48_003328 [Marasmius crinis-equi]|uniref:WD40 repeat-like protein n=1 Tax=Marasmius crinis-equi TaxID=585013 RepID=A0ABR3FT49_9AGAR
MASNSEPRYEKLVQLSGSQGPVNALAFSPDGQRLASGGDDECVRVWSVRRGCCDTVLRPKYDSRFEILGWGQITTAVWISFCDTNEEFIKSHLFFGTARGLLIAAEFTNTKGLTRRRTFSVFHRKDVVESIAIHPTKKYVVMGNQDGIIKLYRLVLKEDCCELELHWVSDESEDIPSIPRSLAFYGKYVVIFWLEAGQISYCEVGEGDGETEQGKLQFHGGLIGNACLSDPPDHLLIHNLASGNFDVYDFPGLSKHRTLAGASHVPIVKQAVFAERNRVAVCGSDDGNVYVYDVQSGVLLQRLNQDQHDRFRRGRAPETVSIQTIAQFTSKERYLVASGASTQEGTIIIWEKPTSVPPRAWNSNPKSSQAARVMIVMSAAVVIFTIVYWAKHHGYFDRVTLADD